MQQYLQQDIKFLPGVGPKRAELLLQELKISTFEDLLTHYPYRYVDRSRFYKISEATSDMPFIQIRGRIHGYTSIGKGRGKRLVGDFRDDSGRIELVWFKGAKWIPENYPIGKELVVFGSSTWFTPNWKIPLKNMQSVQASRLYTQPQRSSKTNTSPLRPSVSLWRT